MHRTVPSHVHRTAEHFPCDDPSRRRLVRGVEVGKQQSTRPGAPCQAPGAGGSQMIAGLPLVGKGALRQEEVDPLSQGLPAPEKEALPVTTTV